MKPILLRPLQISVGLLICATIAAMGQPSEAPTSQPPPRPNRFQELEKAVHLLPQQNEQLRRRVDELEGRKAGPTATTASSQMAASGQGVSNPPPAKVDNEVHLFWKNGLSFETNDKKKFKGKLSGRVQLDAAAFSEDSKLESVPGIGDIPAGTEFRRARLSLEGEYVASVPGFYKIELDFAEVDVAFKDVYLGLADIPAVGKIQVGHFKEPSSLEELSSSRFLTFKERATPVEAFWPERNTGILSGNAAFNNRAKWAVGGFTSTELRAGVDGGQPLDSDYRVVGRLTGCRSTTLNPRRRGCFTWVSAERSLPRKTIKCVFDHGPRHISRPALLTPARNHHHPRRAVPRARLPAAQRPQSCPGDTGRRTDFEWSGTAGLCRAPAGDAAPDSTKPAASNPRRRACDASTTVRTGSLLGADPPPPAIVRCRLLGQTTCQNTASAK